MSTLNERVTRVAGVIAFGCASVVSSSAVVAQELYLTCQFVAKLQTASFTARIDELAGTVSLDDGAPRGARIESSTIKFQFGKPTQVAIINRLTGDLTIAEAGASRAITGSCKRVQQRKF